MKELVSIAEVMQKKTRFRNEIAKVDKSVRRLETFAKEKELVETYGTEEEKEHLRFYELPQWAVIKI